MEVIETRYGKLIAHKNDKYLGKSLFQYGEFSEGEVELFRDFIGKDMVVCDVGANIGAHTLVFSQLAKQVYAYEPVPLNFNALAGMIALNDLRNVICVQMGIGEKAEVMTYMDLDTGRENNFGAARLEKFCGERPVRVFPLNTDCNFLKIDVEGMEVQVLKGARPMIERCQPIIYMEADREQQVPEIFSTLESLGYTYTWHTPPLFNPENFFGNKENVFEGLSSINLLCIHKEKLHGLA